MAGWVEVLITNTILPGDVNLDGVINTDDLGTFLAHWGHNGSHIGWAQGDFNGDGAINTDDLGLLLANWGQSSPAVPEPATLCLLTLGVVGLIRRRRR